MRGFRNLSIILACMGCQTFLAYHALYQGSDLAAFSAILLAITGTAVGGAAARGYNKKVAPEQ